MAGSYSHITGDRGRFIGTTLIENLGDAHEALEECYGMIQYLAELLASTRTAENIDAVRAEFIEDARQNGRSWLRQQQAAEES